MLPSVAPGEMALVADPQLQAALEDDHDLLIGFVGIRFVARAAARHQGAERPVEVQPAGEQVVIDLEDVARRAGDQPDRLVARIARRVRQRFILGANVVQRRGHSHWAWFMLQIIGA